MISKGRDLVRMAANVGSAGMIAAGVLGMGVSVWLGPHVAMGLAIWSGKTTEPSHPELAFPWLLWLLGLIGWAVGLRLQSRGAWAIWLTQGTAALVALLPWYHLWRLWSLAG